MLFQTMHRLHKVVKTGFRVAVFAVIISNSGYWANKQLSNSGWNINVIVALVADAAVIF